MSSYHCKSIQVNPNNMSDVVNYYKFIGFEFEAWSDTGSYDWVRYDENGDTEVRILLAYYEKKDKEGGPSLLVLLEDHTD